MAARLYASGAVPSKRAACRAVGLFEGYLSMLDSAGNEVTNRIQGEVEAAIADETVSMSRVIALMGRKALGKVNTLIDSQKEEIALKASTDILDRNPETSKTFKASITSFNLDAADAKELAAALVASARVKEKFIDISRGDYIKVEEIIDGASAQPVSAKDPQEHNGSREDTETEGHAAEPSEQGQATQGAPQKLRLLGKEEE